MDKGDVIQNIKKRFVDFKERQHDMHSIFMNRYNTIQAKENADISAARKIMNSNQNNKAAKPKQQFVPKQLGSASNEQSNTVNTVNGTSFTNGPSDMMQASQKRSFDQFAGSSSDDGLSKIPRVSDQNKFSRNPTNTPFDVNSNQIQPNVNPFQTKEKPNLSLPVTSMSMSKSSSISTPQVVKNVEELLEVNMNLQQQANNNVKIKSEPSLQSSSNSITTSVSNTQSTVTGFDESLQYFGEIVKKENIKTESDPSTSKKNTCKTSSIDSSIKATNNTQQTPQLPMQQQQQQPQQIQMQQASQKMSQPNQQMQQLNQQIPQPNQQLPQLNQQLPQPNQQVQQQKQQQQNSLQGNQNWPNVLSTNITNVTNQTPMNMMNQVASRPTSTMNMNTTQQMTSGIQMHTGNRPTNTNVGQSLGTNNQHLNQPMQQQQSFSNPTNMSTAMNNVNNMSNMGNNMMNANPNGNMMAVNNGQQPPNLPRINSMTSPRVQLAQHVITKNPPMVSPVPNYMQNHVAPNTSEKLQEYLKRKRQIQTNPKFQQSMTNQMMPSMQNGMPQNNFSYSNDMGFNNQGNMQSQQNHMGYGYPYQMEGGNNPNVMFGNNPPGYYSNKQQNRLVQNMMGRQPMNGMYNPMNMNRQGMNQNIFNMNAKAPPQYTNQGMNSSIMNNQHAMMNPTMQTPNRLSHYQTDTNNMGMPGPLGMSNQMGMRNPMNVNNQFPPPLPRPIMQPNSDNNPMNNTGNNQFSYMNNQQQDPSFNTMQQNNNNMNFNNNVNETLLMRRQKAMRFQQQQQQQQQQFSQQQKNTFQNSNFNTMNTDNNIIMPQDNSGVSNSLPYNNNSNQNFMQQQNNTLSNNATLQQTNTLQQQTSIQNTQQQQPLSQQQATRPQQQQQPSLESQSHSTNSQHHNIDRNLSNNQENLLSPSNSLQNNSLLSTEPSSQTSAGIGDECDDFDKLLDNPTEQFDLINELHSEGL